VDELVHALLCILDLAPSAGSHWGCFVGASVGKAFSLSVLLIVDICVGGKEEWSGMLWCLAKKMDMA